MKHKRELIFSLLFKPGSGFDFASLELIADNSQKSNNSSKKREAISLDSCFKAFSREELLTGADQWYCSKCKEQ